MAKSGINIWFFSTCVLFLYLLFTFSPLRGSMNAPVSASGSSSGALNVKQRLDRAEAIYQETVKRRHAMMKKYKTPDNLPWFAATNAQEYHDSPWTVWDLIPPAFNCPHDVQRVGWMGDGGKWVCGMSKYENVPKDRKCIIYSFGVRDESSFEEEMLERTNCEVFAYDFDVAEFGPQLDKSYLSRAHFFKMGLGKTDTKRKPPFYSLADLMKRNGHDYIDVLKMDIEFAEFPSMTDFMDFHKGANTLPIGQYLVELHLFRKQHKNQEISASDFIKWIERFEALGFRAVWQEINMMFVTQKLDDGMPRLAEMVFVNTKDGRSLLLQE